LPSESPNTLNSDSKTLTESPKKVTSMKSGVNKLDNSFINLTSRETFNNLIGTYSAITLILKNIYEKYYVDSSFAEMVDGLSNQSYSYPS